MIKLICSILKIILGAIFVPFYLIAVVLGVLYALGDGIWKRSKPNTALITSVEAMLKDVDLSIVQDVHRENKNHN